MEHGFDASARLRVRKAYKFYIGGAFVRSESGRTMSVVETPGSVSMENIPVASRKDIRDAVLAARNAFTGWSGRTAYNRGQILYRLAEVVDSRSSEFVQQLEQSGMRRSDAARELADTVDRIVHFAGWTDKFQSLFASYNPVGGPHFNFSTPEPMGIVGAVAPEKPVLLGLVSVMLPILATGNTAVIVASQADPRTCLTFCEALATSDLPGGVVNVVTGNTQEIALALAKHMDVDALEFHGLSKDTCKLAFTEACANVKRTYACEWSEENYFDGSKCETPRELQRFVEMKTVWHPAGP